MEFNALINRSRALVKIEKAVEYFFIAATVGFIVVVVVLLGLNTSSAPLRKQTKAENNFIDLALELDQLNNGKIDAGDIAVLNLEITDLQLNSFESIFFLPEGTSIRSSNCTIETPLYLEGSIPCQVTRQGSAVVIGNSDFTQSDVRYKDDKSSVWKQNSFENFAIKANIAVRINSCNASSLSFVTQINYKADEVVNKVEQINRFCGEFANAIDILPSIDQSDNSVSTRVLYKIDGKQLLTPKFQFNNAQVYKVSCIQIFDNDTVSNCNADQYDSEVIITETQTKQSIVQLDVSAYRNCESQINFYAGYKELTTAFSQLEIAEC